MSEARGAARRRWKFDLIKIDNPANRLLRKVAPVALRVEYNPLSEVVQNCEVCNVGPRIMFPGVDIAQSMHERDVDHVTSFTPTYLRKLRKSRVAIPPPSFILLACEYIEMGDGDK